MSSQGLACYVHPTALDNPQPNMHDRKGPSVSLLQDGDHSNGLRGPGSSDTGNSFTPEKTAKWAVHWHKQPALMTLAFLSGSSAALGHHYFYLRLEGQRPDSDLEKQLALVLGNVLSFLAIFLLRLACTLAYRQYIWTTLKKKSLKLSTLDKLFSLTSDIRGFFSWEVMWRAKVLSSIAAIVWLTPIGGIGLVSTLIVVDSPSNTWTTTASPILNWTSNAWVSSPVIPIIPSAMALGIVSKVAQGMEVMPFRLPVGGQNSSYSMTLRGPYVQCEPTNSSQIDILAGYQYILRERLFATAGEWNRSIGDNSKKISGELVMSAFDPSLGGTYGWTRSYTRRYGDDGVEADKFNNWGVDVPFNASGYFVEDADQTKLIDYWTGLGYNLTVIQDWLRAYSRMVPRQLWVLTSNSSLICTLGNGTRDVDVQFVNGTQTVSYGPLKGFEPIFVPRVGYSPDNALQATDEQYNYVGVYMGLLSMLSGNVTTRHPKSEEPRVDDASSNILLTGLTSCDEFANNYWVDHWYTGYNVSIGEDGNPVEGNETIPEKAPFEPRVFNRPSYMCRNRTLARAIEDLSANITISMLTANEFHAVDTINVPVHITTNGLTWQYDSQTVIISYGLIVFFAAVCVALGFYAFIKNGITHNNGFSGMIATTRNPVLDQVFRGHSTGAKPLSKELEGMRLKFGVVTGSESGHVDHVAFGIKGHVEEMRKGGTYY